MPSAARIGDLIVGGVHCHGMGHTHAPPATPGRIITGASKVFIEGKPAARTGDQGYSPLCCAGIGRIVLQPSQQRVYIEGKPAARIGTPSLHCDMAPGTVKTGARKVNIA